MEVVGAKAELVTRASRDKVEICLRLKIYPVTTLFPKLLPLRPSRPHGGGGNLGGIGAGAGVMR